VRVKLITNCIEVYYKEVNIKASSLRLQYDTIRYDNYDVAIRALPLRCVASRGKSRYVHLRYVIAASG